MDYEIISAELEEEFSQNEEEDEPEMYISYQP